jgi:hypothetical protein
MQRIDRHTELASIGQCIYCRATRDLRDEHVIPFALGGQLVLADASCAACERITSAFEAKVLRGFMYRARNTGKFPTRRPKERPTTTTVTYTTRERKDGHTEPISVDPAFLHLPVLAEAGYFSGNASLGIRLRGVETLRFGPDPTAAIQRKGAEGIEQQDNWDLSSFVRMLAKIGYCWVAGGVGLPPRDEVTVLPLILGQSDDGSRWVGSARYSFEDEREGVLHALSHTAFRKNDNPAHEVLVARVKLFASSGATGYEVIVHHSGNSRVA